jgi:hypothetical protein
MSSDVKVCPLCNKEFGFFRHRYTCAACQETVCDDCTPHKYVIPPKTSAEKVCTACETKLGSSVKTKDGGRRLGAETRSCVKDVDNDREERARIAEQRAAKQKNSAGNQKTTRPAPSAPRSTSDEVHKEEAPVAKEGRTVESTSLDAAMNPVLAAALRREQQGRRNEGGSQMDPERQKLLREIQTALRQKDMDEPFGLRAMDAIKMRLYLRDLTNR